MRYHRTLAAAAIAAGVLASSAANAGAHLIEAGGSVTSLSVTPANGTADVVIGVSGDVTLRHFALRGPDRIVVDVNGATLRLPRGDAYDHVARGGIVDIRYSTFKPGVVRVVLTLDKARTYNVSRDANAIHIGVASGTEKFARWNLEGFGPEKQVASAGAPASAPSVAPAGASSAHTVTVKAAGEPRAEHAVVKATTEAPANSVSRKTTKTAAEEAVMDRVAAEKAEAANTPAEKPAASKTVARKPAEEQSAAVVMPEKTLVAERSAPLPVVEVASQQQQPRQPPITVSWENAPIADVLSQFAAFTGRTILPSKNVTGNITANIVNQPWDVALRAVLNANGFDVTEDQNGIIIVDTFEHIAERQATVPLATRTIRLNYARASAVAPMLEQRLTRACAPTVAGGGTPMPTNPGTTTSSTTCPTRGAVSADSITNSVSITDIPSALAGLEQYTHSLDLRQPQVNIKAKIIFVDRTRLEELGIRYDLGTRQQFFNGLVPRTDSSGKLLTGPGQVLLGGNTLAAMANASSIGRVADPALQLVYSTALGNFDFTTFVDALENLSLADVQAEPSASVLNNRTANLTSGTQVPIRVIDASSGGSATGAFPRAQVQMRQTGVILQVTPSVTANRQIQMRVHVENSSVVFAGGDVGATFPTQQVDNEVLVADGETAVMGGLTKTDVTVNKSGIPILMDLPIIGRLFAHTSRQEQKQDLLILITPHIIDEGQSPPETSPR